MPTYREFLYLDEKLVNELLAQVEDGIFDEDEHMSADTNGDSGTFGARLGVTGTGVEARRTRGNAGSSESRRVYRQTPESRFNRLYESLSGDLTVLTGEDAHVWADVGVRKLIELDGYVDVPSIGRAVAQADQLSEVMDLMKMMAPENVPADAAHTIELFGAMQTMLGGSTVVTVELDESDPSFVAKLDNQWLRVGISDLEGEASVLGRVLRKWPEGQGYPVLAVPGLDVMSRRDRRIAEKASNSNNSSGDFFVQGPGATVSVIAIYR